MKRLVVIAALLMLVCSGCVTHRIGDFTVITNKRVGAQLSLPDVSALTATEGEAAMLYILFIPLGRMPNLEDALDEALEKGKGNLMVDAVAEAYTQTFILFSRAGVRVKGKVVTVK